MYAKIHFAIDTQGNYYSKHSYNVTAIYSETNEDYGFSTEWEGKGCWAISN